MATIPSGVGNVRVGSGAFGNDAQGFSIGSPQKTDRANGTPRTASETRPTNNAFYCYVRVN